MNLNDFEDYFDETILARGFDYYKNGNVVSLEYDGKKWVAGVSGSDDYTVMVTLSSSDEILDTQCDCPYDRGEYCKHQAAVFYALKKKQSNKISAKPEKNSKPETLEDILENLDKQTLLSIIIEFAGRDKRIAEELFLRYSEKTDVLKSARGVIKSFINSVKRGGFVERRDAGRAVDDAITVLQMIDDKIDSDDTMIALQLCILVLTEMMHLFDYCDDSDGVLGEVISEAVEKIYDAVSVIEPDHRDYKKIFDIVFNHAQDLIYDGWTDWRIDLLFAVVPFCRNRTNRDKMEQYLLSQQNIEKNDWISEDKNSQFQKLQFEIIKQFDGETAAADFLERHLDNNKNFRRIAIQTAISGELYDRALTLCLNGEQKDVKYAGLVKEWKEFRYVIYEKIGDIQSQKTFAMEFLLNGYFNYFEKLKALYTEDEWPVVLQDILQQLENNNRRGVYVDILIHEKLKSRLLEFCKKNTSAMMRYYTHLLPEYVDDVGVVFVKHIHADAKNANGRGHYQSICELIRNYKKVCGKEAAYALRDELKEKYPRRKAFLDELGKL